MKYMLIIGVASFFALLQVSPSLAVAPEYKTCHGGNAAACKRWRDRSCKDDANPAACDYEEAKKQEDPFDWCQKRYEDNAAAYRWCVNGSPDK